MPYTAEDAARSHWLKHNHPTEPTALWRRYAFDSVLLCDHCGHAWPCQEAQLREIIERGHCATA